MKEDLIRTDDYKIIKTYYLINIYIISKHA
jgi:hypothetical protein